MSRCICPSCDQADNDRLPDVRGISPIHHARCRELVTDARWGPWCNGCNVRRFARIEAGFTDIQRALSPSGTTTEGGANA